MNPFSAQPAPGEGLFITMVDENENKKKLGFTQSVKMKGGEYIFVPSIDALKSTLGLHA